MQDDHRSILPIIDPLEFLDTKKREAWEIDLMDEEYGNLKGKLLPIGVDEDTWTHAEIIDMQDAIK